METNACEQRQQFVQLYDSGLWSMSELCERFRVSRPTGYKWVARWAADGAQGLQVRSCAPHRQARETPAALTALIVAARQQYGWGAAKLLAVLRRRHPTQAWPTRSTVNAILGRQGLLRRPRRRHRWPHPEAPRRLRPHAIRLRIIHTIAAAAKPKTQFARVQFPRASRLEREPGFLVSYEVSSRKHTYETLYRGRRERF